MREIMLGQRWRYKGTYHFLMEVIEFKYENIFIGRMIDGGDSHYINGTTHTWTKVDVGCEAKSGWYYLEGQDAPK